VEPQHVPREAGAFQQAVSADEIMAACRRAFGPSAVVSAARELSGGLYNSTYLLTISGFDPVVLRVAPHRSRQFRIERDFMRNEHASVPWFAPITHLMPRTLAVDFTHQLIDRDWLIQTYVEGRVAGDGFRALPASAREDFWRQVGTITRAIHGVVGPHFGPVAGPPFPTWSTALIAGFDDIAADLDDAGLDAADVRTVSAFAARHAALLDEITSPRLLHGDLWLGNVLVSSSGEICGVLDSDRAWFGDPLADWNIYLISTNPGLDLDTFWDTYGRRDPSPAARLRSRFYHARFVGGSRLEFHRLGETDRIPETYTELAGIVAAVSSGD
jgi:aminoglycoside phosphotransferase (APT) family kinase protein